MSLRTIFLVLLALACAGATILFARDWVIAQRQTAPVAQSAAPAAEAPKPQPFVLVAAEDMPAGSFVRKESLKWQPWPADGLNDKFVTLAKTTDTDAAGKEEIQKMVGAVSRSAIVKGQPITESLLVHPGDRGFLAAVLTPGNRAVSVPVNATTGISGFIFPGDLVDLLLTVRFRTKEMKEDGSSEEGDDRHATKTILHGIRVLAIDQIVQKTEGEATVAKNVTLEVSPKDSEKVAVALEMGSLSLSLRSLATGKEQETTGPGHKESAGAITFDAEVMATRMRSGNAVTVLRGGNASKKL